MTYQVLARKWRPRSFATLVGQSHVVRALTHALTSGRIHHAYLLTGTRGVGKTTIARILAKALNCETGVAAEPCGQCTACQEVDQGRFVDLIEVDAANNTRVDEMRELLDNAVYMPTRGRYKVYVIDEVHMLSNHSFNAMLKTLEEPPPHVVFILATTDPQKVPVTVLSRCLQFNLKQMVPPAIVAHLTLILQAEGIDFEPEALSVIAVAAAGSMRDALSLLDQAIAHGGGKVAHAAVVSMLGVVDQRHLLMMLADIGRGDAKAVLATAAAMAEQGLSFAGAFADLGRLLLSLQIAQLAPDALADEMVDRDLLLSLARQWSPDYVQLAYQICCQGRAELHLAPDEYTGWQMALLRLLAFIPAATPTAETDQWVARPTVEPEPLPPPTAAAITAPVLPDPVERQELCWSDLVASLPLKSMAMQLARNCSLVERSTEAMRLCLDADHAHLLQDGNVGKLRAALVAWAGHDLTVNIDVGEPQTLTPAKRDEQARLAARAEVESNMRSDPAVRAVERLFDGELIADSIRPPPSPCPLPS